MSISSELPENVADLQAMILRLDRELGEARQQFGEARQQVDEIQVEFEQQERVLNATEASYEELRQTHQAALEELETLRRWMYGRRSERIDDPNGCGRLGVAVFRRFGWFRGRGTDSVGEHVAGDAKGVFPQCGVDSQTPPEERTPRWNLRYRPCCWQAHF